MTKRKLTDEEEQNAEASGSVKVAVMPVDLHSSPRPAPAFPAWLLEEREAMRIRGDHIRNCAVFLGWKNEAGFLAEGIGFFVSLEVDGFVFTYVISAAHILWPTRKSGGKVRDKIDIRVNSESGEPAIISTKAEEWLFHPDKSVDLCAYEFDISKHSPSDDLEINRLDLESMVISEGDLQNKVDEIGDEAAIIGAFVGRIGRKKNIPVVSIAIPSSLIWQFLNGPDIIKRRETALDIRRRRSGFRPT